jgi:hypothetical protein
MTSSAEARRQPYGKCCTGFIRIKPLEEAREYGIAIMFEPDLDENGDEAGWTINYVIHDWPAAQGQTDWPGDRLSSAYDLETACAAARKPLHELGGAYRNYLRNRTT